MITAVRNVTSSPTQLFGVAVVLVATLIGSQFLVSQKESGLFDSAGATDPIVMDAPVVADNTEPIDNPFVAGAPADAPVGDESAVADNSEAVAETSESAGEVVSAPDVTLTPTYSWFNVYGDDARIGDRPVQPGDVITAHDSDGSLAGRFTVTDEGRFGLMAVYYDDPATEEDEGMGVGDAITFKINGQLANLPSQEQPKWNANTTLLYVNLQAAG